MISSDATEAEIHTKIQNLIKYAPDHRGGGHRSARSAASSAPARDTSDTRDTSE